MVTASLVSTSIETPVGVVRLLARGSALRGVFFADHRHLPAWVEGAVRVAGQASPVLALAASELQEFFAGERRDFRTPLAAIGTQFQEAVWQALREIPFGERRSYTELAERIGKPRAVRAVASANAHNPLSIFVPCHRVIGASGALTGYAGGLEAKRWLLAHETRAAGATEVRAAAAPSPKYSSIFA